MGRAVQATAPWDAGLQSGRGGGLEVGLSRPAEGRIYGLSLTLCALGVLEYPINRTALIQILVGHLQPETLLQ